MVILIVMLSCCSNIYADDIMRIINSLMNPELVDAGFDEEDDDYVAYDPSLDPVNQAAELLEMMEENKEVIDIAAETKAQQDYYDQKIYAKGEVAKSAFVTVSGQVRHEFDEFF